MDALGGAWSSTVSSHRAGLAALVVVGPLAVWIAVTSNPDASRDDASATTTQRHGSD